MLYSRCNICACSRVTDMAVRSLALLQLVTRPPRMHLQSWRNQMYVLIEVYIPNSINLSNGCYSFIYRVLII